MSEVVYLDMNEFLRLHESQVGPRNPAVVEVLQVRGGHVVKVSVKHRRTKFSTWVYRGTKQDAEEMRKEVLSRLHGAGEDPSSSDPSPW